MRFDLSKRPWLRRVLSLLIAAHLVAVFAAPFNMASGGDSPLGIEMRSWFAPYLQAINMDSGYGFFAPEPGPSHLIRFEIERADGTTVTGKFPDKVDNWPRLLYHRHFMMTDMAIANIGPRDPSWAEEPRWELHRNTPWQMRLARSYADHLLHEYNGVSIRMYLVQHRLSGREEITAGKKLSEPGTYRERLLGNFTAVEFKDVTPFENAMQIENEEGQP